MQPVPQDLLKDYVQSQHFTSTTEIMEAQSEYLFQVSPRGSSLDIYDQCN